MDTLLTPRFHVKGTSLQAWRCLSGGTAGILTSSAAAGTIAVASSSDIGAFGGSMIQMASNTYEKALMYPGLSNWTDSSVGAFAVLMRIIPRWTGAPTTAEVGLWWAMLPATNSINNGVYCEMGVNGAVYLGYDDKYGNAYANGNESTAAFSGFTSGTAIDLLVVWNGIGNTAYVYAAGVQIGTLAFAANSPSVNNQLISCLKFGGGITDGGSLQNYDINEIAVWDYALSSTDIANLTARTTFLATTQFDATLNTSPGASNVLSTASFYCGGNLINGNVVLNSPSNVRSGVMFGPSSSLEGTCAVPTASETLLSVPVDATVGNVVLAAESDTRLGVGYGPSSSLEGTCAVATASETLLGVAIDDTVGNVVLPPPAEALTTAMYGPEAGTQGTYVATATDDVVDGTEFGPGGSLTGTFSPLVITNTMTQMEIQQNPTTPGALVITQGDELEFNLLATADTGLPFDLTGVTSISTKMLNEDGVTYTTWDASAHTINPDQVDNKGQYTLMMTDTECLKVGDTREMIMTLISGGKPIHFHGTMEVLSSKILS